VIPRLKLAAHFDMAPQAYDKRCIALAQIETALRLFFEGVDLFSVVTLAGAAEEIFGKLVRARGGANSLDELAKAGVAIHQFLFKETAELRSFRNRANRARNASKHLNADEAPTITLDLRQEAIDLLHRAIENYWLLETAVTPAMERFIRESAAE
jgi:hypothetical protein